LRRLIRWLRELVLLPLHFYRRFISPWTPATCRFSPTCSQYGIDAVRTHGILRGGAMTIWRVLRCNPLGRGGQDPVPPGRGGRSATESAPPWGADRPDPENPGAPGGRPGP